MRTPVDRATLSHHLEEKRDGWIVAHLRTHSFLSDRFPYLYLATPKSASTATKVILWSIEGYPTKDFMPARSVYEQGADDPRPSLATISPDKALRALDGDQIVRFCVWRDPVDRLASAFADRIIAETNNPRYADLRIKIAAQAGCDDPATVPFESFVSLVADTPDHLRDVHWRSQYSLTFADAIPYDYVARQPRLHEDLPIILEACGVPVPHQEFLQHRWRDSSGRKPSVSNALAKRIRAMFEQDYLLPERALRGAF